LSDFLGKPVIREISMRSLQSTLWAFVPALLLIQTMPSLAQTVCGAPDVKLGNNYIQVAPTGVDDTENIQCALDLAVYESIPEIRLTPGEFFISSLSARGYAGTLQGSGRDHTRVNLLHQSIDCAAIEARGELPAAIRFAGGEPRIRWLTLVAAYDVLPCASGGSRGGALPAMVHFTGRAGNPPACSADVVYGTIDRVNLEGPRIYSWVPQPVETAILVSPQPSGNPECLNSLLGSVRINRALVDGFPAGSRINMRGDAQVSVLNTNFAGNHYGLELVDSNAVVTVFGNRFASKSPGSYSCCEGGGTGLAVDNLAESGGATRLDVRSNTFEVSSGGFDWAWGIWLRRNPGATSIQPVLVSNHFRLTGGDPSATAVSTHGVSGGLVSDCSLWGSGQFLVVTSGDIGQADRWTVVSNRGLAELNMLYPDDADIYLGENSSNALIGPGQSAVVRDEGIDNITLPQ
jgi:hypothetical protein